MTIKPFYFIRPQFARMSGQRDRNGKQCALVVETGQSFIVDQSPLEIIQYSTLYVGYSLKGATEAARWLLGDIQMCPVIVNPIQGIVLFPTRSSSHEDTIWLNPAHIQRCIPDNGKSLVLFKNQTAMTIHQKPISLNNKLVIATDLIDMVTENARQTTFALVLDPKKRTSKRKSKSKLK